MGEVWDFEYHKNHFLTWSDDPFQVNYARCVTEPLDFRSECVQAVKNLCRTASGPIGVLFSGGVDSELICRSFRDAGAAFTALIIQFGDSLNRHEVDFATAMCQRVGWKHEIIHFDIENWFNNELYALAEEYGITHPELAVHMRMLELASEAGYTPIDGRGDINLINLDGRIVWKESRESVMVTRFLSSRGIEACPRFFKYSAELVYSWLTDPMMQRWIALNVPLKMRESHDFKMMIYSQYWENLEPRVKYTGFEYMLKTYRVHRDRIRDRLPKPPVFIFDYKQTVEQMRFLSAPEPLQFANV